MSKYNLKLKKKIKSIPDVQINKDYDNKNKLKKKLKKDTAQFLKIAIFK